MIIYYQHQLKRLSFGQTLSSFFYFSWGAEVNWKVGYKLELSINCVLLKLSHKYDEGIFGDQAGIHLSPKIKEWLAILPWDKKTNIY